MFRAHDSVSVIGSSCPQNERVCNHFGYYSCSTHHPLSASAVRFSRGSTQGFAGGVGDRKRPKLSKKLSPRFAQSFSYGGHRRKEAQKWNEPLGWEEPPCANFLCPPYLHLPWNAISQVCFVCVCICYGIVTYLRIICVCLPCQLGQAACKSVLMQIGGSQTQNTKRVFLFSSTGAGPAQQRRENHTNVCMHAASNQQKGTLVQRYGMVRNQEKGSCKFGQKGH